MYSIRLFCGLYGVALAVLQPVALLRIKSMTSIAGTYIPDGLLTYLRLWILCLASIYVNPACLCIYLLARDIPCSINVPAPRQRGTNSQAHGQCAASRHGRRPASHSPHPPGERWRGGEERSQKGLKRNQNSLLLLEGL